jgi:hypothetical protein
MTPSEFDHIKVDIRTAVVENRHDDPGFLPEFAFFLLEHMGHVAQGHPIAGGLWASEREWAEHVLRKVQVRAISQIPFGEEPPPEPEDHR